MYTRQEILNQIRSLADGNKPPTKKEFKNCPHTASFSPVRRLFDTWNGALEAAGYSPRNERPSKQEVIKQIDSLADGDKPPTTMEFNNCPETVSLTPVKRLFDTWNGALEAAGYSPRLEKRSKEKVINQIDFLADGNKPPSLKEFINSPETMSFGPVERLFDTWNEAVEAAGYSPQRRYLDKQELLAALQRAADAGDVDQIKMGAVSSGSYPSRATYRRRFGGISVAAMRGSIDIDLPGRYKTVPLTKPELDQFIDSIPENSPRDQAVALMSLLTGCADSEHKIAEEGFEETETDSLVVYPTESKRGSRSVSVGPLYNQLVKVFDPITPGRLTNSMEFSNYPPSKEDAIYSLRRVSRSIDFDVDRTIVGEQQSQSGPRVLHRDLRCTHYLFERVRGASQALLRRRLALSDDEVKHYNRYLNDDQNEWTVRIEWRD